MKTLKIIVSGGKDSYGAWVKDVPGIYGVGTTLEELKNNIKEAIILYLEYNENAPDILKDTPQLDLIFDITGLVKHYSRFISFPAMEHLTGINQKQLWQYANGYKTPRKETADRILDGLKHFARKLENEKVAG